ncbi:MAG: carboxypeptidase regulatory-like domain-containing protein [Anaerolineae bacterium]|jgi:hypothetical protein|nr:carboxypeptidase regulatory-like domain-containing protein [Anaerolineae bacterium]MBT3711956.1 carboxypeptidase regulatory-like domain-containing protein [Anaerolineae bacterium]MBT4310913.1 carboxypeptidase regulatory-like domain-containing protein [Anaerolineae bacterium]MBT4457767.1 carboxypeptidase regulatory-like domain-containing protein [Anaerolineae bacterium]MBT4843401.1 carboxypeptidase regulatory-like domain-containing protein [Anaerolineae bacterium]
MTLQDSPSLEDFSDGILPPPDKPDKKRRTTIVIVGLLVLIILLLGISFIQSDAFSQIAGQGTISGYAVDESNQPIAVDIIIFGTNIRAISDESGYFEVENIPSGQQSIIIAFGEIATEEIVTVQVGQNTELGTVTVPTESEIDY